MPIRLFIDQGHNPGTINAGAQANGLIEAEVTYQVGIYLQQLLQEDCRFEVKLSRNDREEVLGTDTRSSLETRVAMANEWPADYFISIHANYNPNPALDGSEVYIFKRDSVAQELATDVLEGIVEVARTRNNGVRVNPLLYVLRATTMPAILVELGYLTNENDALKMKEDLFLFALGIYVGILRYFDYLT